MLSTESNVYQIETNKAKKIIEGINEELNLVIFIHVLKFKSIHKNKIVLQTKQKYLELKKTEVRQKETIGKLKKQMVYYSF